MSMSMFNEEIISPVPIQTSVRVAALIECVPEDLPAESALAAHEYPGELPEAGG